MTVEPFRTVPVRLRHGHRYRNLAVMGMPAGPDLSRIVELSGHVPELPPEGLLISRILGEVLGVEPGDTVMLEVLEGARPVREAVVAGLVDDTMGVTAWMEIWRPAPPDARGRVALRRPHARRSSASCRPSTGSSRPSRRWPGWRSPPPP